MSTAVVYRARAFDTPDDPFGEGATAPGFRYDDDLGLAVSDDGVILARGPFASVAAAHPGAPVIDLREGILLPGLVDTHVHYPQVRVIGALGMPLLEWLERCALPEEQHLAKPDYAATIAYEFVGSLIAAGTTTSLVFGSHFAPAVDALFAEAERYGLRVTSGLVVSDRGLPEPLLTTPERAYAEAVDLASWWHGRGRLRYAVTPRFSLSASDPVLAACGAVLREVEGALFTSHVNENQVEVATVTGQFPAFQEASYPVHRTALLPVDLERIATECGLSQIEIHYSLRGRIPLTALHYPALLSRALPRALSDNVLMVGCKDG